MQVISSFQQHTFELTNLSLLCCQTLSDGIIVCTVTYLHFFYLVTQFTDYVVIFLSIQTWDRIGEGFITPVWYWGIVWRAARL